MATGSATWNGYTILVAYLEDISNIDYSELITGNADVAGWNDVIIEDNRVGLLAGKDKNGNPSPTLKYRTGTVVKERFRKRDNPLLGRTRGEFKGFGPLKSGLHGNLTTREYQKLTGPYGIPRGEDSRLVANLTPREPVRHGNTWIAECAWLDVVGPNGEPFLQHLIKRYPIDGVRPIGREKCRQMLRSFISAKLKRK